MTSNHDTAPAGVLASGVLRRVFRVAAAGWSAVIFALSALPGSSVPGRFGGLAHFAEYLVLAALLVLSVSGRRPLERVLLAVAAASAYAVTDEVHQAFVPMRMPDPLDWGVDTAGAIVGAVTMVLVIRSLSRMTRDQ